MIHLISRAAVLAALGCAVAIPAFAEIKSMPLPTAEDGDILYRVDTVTKAPINAKDDRAEVLPVVSYFLPRENAGGPKWAFRYDVRFKPHAKPASIRVETENVKPVALEVEDKKPVLKSGVWTGTTQPIEFNKAWFDRMSSEDPWILQRRVTIVYADGKKSVMHQLTFITKPMRMKMIGTLMPTEPK